MISDERSMMIFFQELSNAYLFITQQATLHIQTHLHSYKHYIAQTNETIQQHASTDAKFWTNYLQDTGMFCFPQQHIVKKRKISATHIPLTEACIATFQQFCTQHQLGLNDGLSAAISLALLQSCNNDINCAPHKLCLSLIKSNRHDPRYDHSIGCFLRMDTIKLDLHNQPSLLALAKQAQQSAHETAIYQRAACLIKLGALGKLPQIKNPLTKLFITMALSTIAKFFSKRQWPANLISACKNIAIADRTQQFLINININNSFLENNKHPSQENLFGLSQQEIPFHTYPIHVIDYVLDVWFHRNHNQNIPFITIAGNLTSEFQTRFGKTLQAMIEHSLD